MSFSLMSDRIFHLCIETSFDNSEIIVIFDSYAYNHSITNPMNSLA
jgi:hypothetical protein